MDIIENDPTINVEKASSEISLGRNTEWKILRRYLKINSISLFYFRVGILGDSWSRGGKSGLVF